MNLARRRACAHPIASCRQVKMPGRETNLYYCTACDLVQSSPATSWHEPRRDEAAAIAAFFAADVALRVVNATDDTQEVSVSCRVTLPASDAVLVDRVKLEQARELARYLSDGRGTHFARIDKAAALAELVLSLSDRHL
jgi:hypothetical protein